LQAILSQPQEEDAELTFSEEIDEQFVEDNRHLNFGRQLKILVCANVPHLFQKWFLERLKMIPSSLYKEDIEQFDKQLIDFFIAYENKY
jgi:hypothetical protein